MSLLRISILSLCEVFGDFMLKSYSATGLQSSLGFGIVGYIGVIVSLIWSFQTGNVLLVNGLWDGMSAVIESILAYVILGDRLTNPYQYVGLFVTILGMFLLRYSPK